MSSITSLPPPNEIQDPSARQFCEAVFNLIEARSGNIEGARNDRFITYDELGTLVEDEVLNMFSTGTSGARPGPPRSPSDNADRFRRITNRIMNSELWRVLGEEFRTLVIPDVRTIVGPLSDGITAINSITSTSSSRAARTIAGLQVSFGNASAQIAAINDVSADSSSASARYLFTVNARLSDTIVDVDRIDAGLTTEISARVNNRTALASAINTIWTMFGSESQAIAQSGDSLQSNADVSQATKWRQVQAAVTDPNTGLISSASVLEESRAFADNVNNKLSAMYTVKVQLAADGQTPLVGGFGIEGSIGSSGLPEFAFGVRADTFWVGSVSGAPNQVIPFVVITTPGQVVDGVEYSDVGVWLNTARMIGLTTIDYAQITDTLESNNYVPGRSGWRIYKDGYAEFADVRVRGHIEATSGSFGRLLVTDAVEGSITVEDNSPATVVHGENRRVMVTLWVPGSTGQLAYIADMDMNSFTVRAAFAGRTTIGYRYW